MKRKLQTLEDRLEVAEHDRDLYKTELKTSKKKNKVLLAGRPPQGSLPCVRRWGGRSRPGCCPPPQSSSCG